MRNKTSNAMLRANYKCRMNSLDFNISPLTGVYVVLIYDDEIYIVELIKPCNEKEWYVREDKS